MSNEQNNSNENTSENTAETNANTANEEQVVLSKPEFEKLKQDLDQARKDQLYVRAEFDTFRRNIQKEKEQLRKYGAESALRELINVFDNFELATQTKVSPEAFENFERGIHMIRNEFLNVFENMGVKQFAQVGDSFDPSIHEALGQDPSTDIEAGKICKIFRKAYKFHDRLLRPAQVIISSKAESNN